MVRRLAFGKLQSIFNIADLAEIYAQSDSLCSRNILSNLQCGSLGNVSAELRGELGEVVGEDSRLVAGARDGDVAKTGVDKVRVNAGVSVHEHTLGSEPLGAVAGDSVAVVEVAMLDRIKIDLAAGVEVGLDSSIAASIGRNGIDDGQVAVGDAERLVGRSELDSVASGKLAVDLAVDADAR